MEEGMNEMHKEGCITHVIFLHIHRVHPDMYNTQCYHNANIQQYSCKGQ